MPAPSKRTVAQLKVETDAVLVRLKEKSSARFRDGLARYGLPVENALGVPMRAIQLPAKKLGRHQELASALWETRCYEARLLTAYIGEPERITSAEMDRWCGDFDNWAVVDTLCFSLFDRSPFAWGKVERWTKMTGEFQRRAGYVLLACLAAHDREAADDVFLKQLSLIERGAADERNFVKKGVSWALRMIGRRSPELHAASIALAGTLAESEQPGASWVGKDALKQLQAKTTLQAVARNAKRMTAAAAGDKRSGLRSAKRGT